MKLYSKEEWGYGKGYRTPEWDAGTVEECKDYIEESEYKIIQDLST